ncbi:MAG: Inositol-pentakisphosphate 2-kinase [Phylliscum demangeonii]|nr:MAG: Inositol-pentakisphosphate 2-kinase [Phylliscum demangeonii]
MPALDTLRLLPRHVELQYLGEGAANIVYRIVLTGGRLPAPSSPSADLSCFENRLLRLRKQQPPSSSSSSSTSSPPRAAENVNEDILRLLHASAAVIAPLFPAESVLAQDPVRVPAHVIAALNARLRDAEANETRPRARRGVYLAFSSSSMSLSSPSCVESGGGGGEGGGGGGRATLGLLVMDMTSAAYPRRIAASAARATAAAAGAVNDDDDNVVIAIEFKPKWLVQSPSAPPGARRCRTCALRAQRMAKEGAGQMKTSASASAPAPPSSAFFFCPLDLMSDDQPRVRVAVDAILAANQARLLSPTTAVTGAAPTSLRSAVVAHLAEPLTTYLHHHPLLQRLRQLQQTLDPLGILRLVDSCHLHSDSDSDSHSHSQLGPPSPAPSLPDAFLLAMTLRDCTFFIRARVQTGATGVTVAWEARLGDLDLKSPHAGKGAYWRALEDGLLRGGWYLDGGDGDGGRRAGDDDDDDDETAAQGACFALREARPP